MKKSAKTILFTALAVLVLAAGIFAFLLLSQPAVPDYPAEMSPKEAAARVSAGAILLDVRTPQEWNELHVPGAVLIPLAELQARAAEVPSGKEVMIICRSGNRSAQARDLLRQAGYTRSTSVAGGIRLWQSEGLPVTTGP